MAGLIFDMASYVKAWWHYTRLDKPDFVSARISMQALRELGRASLPTLRHGIGQKDHPRIQYRSAVVLHWLGERDGLPVLIDAVRYGHKPLSDRRSELVNCFLQIKGSDTSAALAELWTHLPNISDSNPTATTISEVWREQKDINVLPALCSTCAQTPRLFLQTTEAYGLEALPELRRLSGATESAQRTMALRGLQLIPGPGTSAIVEPLLRDPAAEVRRLAPGVLESVEGPVSTLNAVVAAHRAGYSTAESVQMLVLYSPPDLYDLLAALLKRYGRGESAVGDGRDTVGAAREAALAFFKCPWPNVKVLRLLCSIDARNVHPTILAAASHVIGERGKAGDDTDAFVYQTMWRQLTSIDREARGGAAFALAQFGEPFGAAFDALLDSGRPQASLLRKLQATLMNSQDMGQAVSEAVQHVTSWFSRVSRVTAERFSSSSLEPVTGDAALQDERLPAMLTRILASVLSSLAETAPEEVTVEALSVGVGALRALARLGTAARCASVEIAQAFTTLKLVPSSDGVTPSSADDVAAVLRNAAGKALISINGPGCFPTLAGGLLHEGDAVKITSAAALGQLADSRAMPLLQDAAASTSPLVAQAARNAISTIKRVNPEMMTLLRGSSAADANTGTLLRPTKVTPDVSSGEMLLRPGNPDC